MENKGRKKGNILKILGITIGALFLIIAMLVMIVPKVLFTDYDGLKTSGSYEVETTNAILIDESRIEAFEQDGSKREVPICIYYPKTEAKESFPVVFFSHGAFGYGKSNFSTYMELASNGYVVISMEHPYHSFFTKDTNGKTVTVNPEFINNAMRINGEDITEEEIFDITNEWIKLRIDDANYAVDSVKKAAEDKKISDSWYVEDNQVQRVQYALAEIDTEKIGFMGHSLGGATAVSLGRIRNDLSAVVDLDGTMLGEITGVVDGKEIVCDGKYTTPILSFDNEEHYTERRACTERNEVYVNNIVLSQAENGFSTYIKGTGHMNYTDLPLFSPILAEKLGTGDVDSTRCIQKMNEIILNYFDCFLKGKGSFSVEEGYQV